MPAKIFCFDTRSHSFRDHFVIAIFVVVESLVMIFESRDIRSLRPLII